MANAQKPVLKVVETVVVPERTTTIPQRNAREVLQKKGHIKIIRVGFRARFRGRCHCFSWTGMLVCVTIAFKC